MVRKSIKQLSILSLIIGFIGMGQVELMVIDIADKIFSMSIPFIPIPIVSTLSLILGIKCKRKIKELGISNESLIKDEKRANIGIILSILGIIRFYGDIYLVLF